MYTDTETFLTTRYSLSVFMGIIIDTKAVQRSIAGESQFLALQRIRDVKLNKSRAEKTIIKFGIR